MHWLQKTPTKLFHNIPIETLEQLVLDKKHTTSHAHLSNLELLNYLLSRHIINKYHVPVFVITPEQLTRWLFCIYVIE